MGLGIGVVSLLVGIVLVFIARPKINGENPSFVKGTFAEMLYPVACLGLIVVGLSLLFSKL